MKVTKLSSPHPLLLRYKSLMTGDFPFIFYMLVMIFSDESLPPPPFPRFQTRYYVPDSMPCVRPHSMCIKVQYNVNIALLLELKISYLIHIAPFSLSKYSGLFWLIEFSLTYHVYLYLSRDMVAQVTRPGRKNKQMGLGLAILDCEGLYIV